MMRFANYTAVFVGALLLIVRPFVLAKLRSPRSHRVVGRFSLVATVSLCMVVCVSLYYFSTTAYIGANSILYDWDAQYWYAGGKTWLAGESPYDTNAFKRVWINELGEASLPSRWGVAFVYPPTLLLIGIPMALLPWSLAAPALRIASVLSFIGIILMAVRLGGGAGSRPWRELDTWVCAGMSCLLLSVSQTIYQGQVSLIVVFGMMLAFSASQGRSTAVVGVMGLLLASIKPQISLPLLIYVLVRGPHRHIVVGLLTTVAMSLALLVATPVTALVENVRTSLSVHMGEQDWNQLSRYDSLPSLLGTTPYAKGAAAAGIALGVLVAALLATRQRQVGLTGGRQTDRHVLHLLLALSVALMPLHWYDTVLYVPLVAHLAFDRSAWKKLLVIGAVFVHSYVWDKRLLILLNLPLHNLDLRRAMDFTNANFWLNASQWAAVMSGVVLALVAVFWLVHSREVSIVDSSRVSGG